VTDLLQRVENSIQGRRLFQRGGKILVAVSGGLDSMVLLHAIKKISGRRKREIVVAHFNHRLRGRASDADEKLVRTTAAEMRLPFAAAREDVKKFAAKSKLSIEMAARKLRCEFFARVARERKIQVVVLAHHADDQVELFFLRLLRGAGGEGLAGMKWSAPSPADKKITLVRPLLDLTKTELREFARENKIRFRGDATNTTLDARRNRVRNELLPLLRKNYQPGLTKTVLRLMEIIGAESDLVGEAAEQWFARRTPVFKNLPVPIQRRVLQSRLERLNVATDFELVERLRESDGKFVSVGSGLSVSRDAGGGLKLREQPSAEFNPNELEVNLAGRAGGASFDGVKFSWRFDAAKNFQRPGKKIGCEFFDAEKVGCKMVLRHWRAGDRFQPIGLKSAAKLQDLFTNQKIPHERRRKLIVATAATGKIFWVEGLRISENFKLMRETKQRLVWRWRKAD
jgi:tRNA(Ile)-lysidine synthase